ncbi:MULTISPECIES: type II secretion system minor pseudopilin GspJ [unclassified Psychrobacter]|uniref:type II secretion system minor pseudopilin GspJ n=1 Tax=unclassified Psychrobacter TaxID=196806 RepID=UPI0018F4B946|nr:MULTISPECIES: type II secretion system minor pseudopilin GspJ [unclassified Psychrobacter]
MRQRGFTLLELLVAMVIFAMLAVAGWQVFDGVSKARERAQIQADILADMQYSYLQIQQDMAQLVAYESLTAADAPTNTMSDPAQQIAPTPFLTFDTARVEFIRFADPDPRYRSSPTLQRVAYEFAGSQLIRHQYVSLDTSNNVSIDSVLLSAVSDGRWQAYLPEVSDRFPDDSNTNTAQDDDNNERILLPKGIGVSFSYQDRPLAWRWALAPQPVQVPKVASNTSKTDNGGVSENNGNDDGGASGTDPVPPATNTMSNTGGIVPEQSAQGAGL